MKQSRRVFALFKSISWGTDLLVTAGDFTVKKRKICNSPVSQYERPRLRLPVPHVSTKPLKSSLSLHAKILYYVWNEWIKYCKRYHYEVNRSVVTCKLLMSVYLDIKSLYPHLKVNWNVLLCKICIARRLVVDIFPWCNANYVAFPSGTLVARRMRNGSIEICI